MPSLSQTRIITSMIARFFFLLCPLLLNARPLTPLPEQAELVFHEDWSGGRIDPARWYPLRKQWGQGNHGVVPENLAIVPDLVDGKEVKVLRCQANGDAYDGPVTGLWGQKSRVGGVLVSKPFFASGRFEVLMKIGDPEHPTPPGIIPAIWTYASRSVIVPPEKSDDFQAESPLYHPYLQQWGKGHAFYWSELDFPEFGKQGDYTKPLYNTFLNKMHEPKEMPSHGAADGRYHRYVTEWRTELVPFPEVRDEHVREAEGYHWIASKDIPYEKYFGQPLKKIGPNDYALYAGKVVDHWIDGKYVGRNDRFVPSMAAQLNIGVWLPDWAGPAPWQTRHVYFSEIKVWQFHDSGDVRGILTEDIADSFDEKGQPIKR
ncbi:MAG: glycoside hydrolase family 16 protein [Verrucomicrobiales bacterium]